MNDERKTPIDFFTRLDSFWGFTLDPCTTEENPLGLEHFYTKLDNGLAQNWHGHAAFVNPPYSRGNIDRWLAKASAEACMETFIAVLVPGDHSTHWHRRWVRDNPRAWYEWRIPFRIAFDGLDAGAKFASSLVLFGGPFADPCARCHTRARPRAPQVAGLL